MKRLLIIFMILFSLPAFADTPLAPVFGTAKGDNKVKFKAETVEQAIGQMVARENQTQTVAEYQKQMDKTTGEISISGLYKVCYAAGWDVRQTGGYNDCKRFVQSLLAKILKGGGADKCFGEYNGTMLDGKCIGRDGQPVVYAKSCDGGGGECVKIFAGLQTQAPNGKEFIYQYGKMRGITFTCANYGAETRKGVTSPLGQDFLRCTANGKAYEFEFDDLNQNPNKTSAASENKAICETLYGGKITKYGGRDFEVYCDMPNCERAMSLARTIGRRSGISGCNFKTDVDAKEKIFLRTAYGIDNKVFYKSKIQSRADLVQKQLEDYLRTHPSTRGQQFIRCDSQIKTIKDATSFGKDYFMTCTVGSQQIDFVFDDLTEALDSYTTGGAQAMSCIVSGGTYTGKKCIGLDETQCIALARANIADCSECKAARWDTDPNNPSAKTCVLPSSAKMTSIQKGVKVAGIAGLAVAGAVITVATAGTGAGAVAIVFVEVAGAGIEIASEIKLSKIAQQWLSHSESCKKSSCAESMLRDDLQRMSNLASSFTEVEIAAIDAELERLIKMLPPDSPVYKKTLAENSLGFFDSKSWEPEQVWRAVGIGMQLASIVTAVGKFTVTKLNRSTAALKRGLQQSASHADDLAKVGTQSPTPRKTMANIADAEDQAGYAAMMKRVDEVNAKNITAEDLQAELIKRGYSEEEVANRVKNYNDYLASHTDNSGKAIDTQSKYQVNGKYTPERQKVHEEIIENFFKQAEDYVPAAGEKPTFVMLGGRGGSGKSALKNLGAYDETKTLVVDPDAIKEMLPEYKKLVDGKSQYAGLNAWEVHEESSDIANMMLDMAQKKGINVVLDGTMSSTNSVLKKLTPFENAGYRIEGAYMHLPRDEAAVSAMNRGMGSGRYVPPEVLLKNMDNEKVMTEVSEHFDSWQIWGNDFQKGGDAYIISTSAPEAAKTVK